MTLVTIYSRDGGSETLPIGAATHRVNSDRGRFSFEPFDPPGWELEVPVWEASRNIHGSPNPRHREEKPFSISTDNDCWQYSDREIAAGERFSSTAWPHASFRPVNTSARKIYDFFTARQKSRLQVSPWRDGRVHLDDGLSGPADFQPPRPQPTSPRFAA